MAGIGIIILTIIVILIGYIVHDKIKGEIKSREHLSILRSEEFISLKKNVKTLAKFKSNQVIIENVLDAEIKLRLLAKNIESTNAYNNAISTPYGNKIRSSLSLFKYVNQLNNLVSQLPDLFNNLDISTFEDVSQNVLELTSEIQGIDENIFVLKLIQELNNLHKDKSKSSVKVTGNGTSTNPYLLDCPQAPIMETQTN